MKLPEELVDYSDAIDAFRTIGRVRWAILNAIGKQVRAEEEMPFEQVEALMLVADSPGEALRMGDLASLTLKSKSSMTRLVDRMERDGLMRRQASITDRRSVLVALTDEGRDLIERMKPAAVQIMIDRFASHISAEEARIITSSLTRILEANGVNREYGFESDDTEGENLHAATRIGRAG